MKNRSVRMTAGAVAILSAAVVAAPVAGQIRPDPPPVSAAGDTVPVVPAPQYEAGGLHRTLLGDGWRNVWLTPADVAVFDFDTYAGGVEWTERGGGNQSMTLHLEEVDGWGEHIFRSANKFPEQAMPVALQGTPAGRMLSDLISSFFPAAPILVPPFVAAIGLPHVEPVLRVMPDDPRLGVYQDTFAGMLATVEIKPNEAPEDEPGYAGSRKIKGTEEFYNDLEESRAHRLDERRFLASRLVDFLINDPDRTRDNMRWARYGEEGNYQWLPLPIDRDWSFVDSGGWLTTVIRGFYPKLVPFGPEFPSLAGLTYGSHQLDRRLLQRLTRSEFQAVAAEVQEAISDSVIEAAIARMPERWQRETGAPERIRSSVRGRRQNLDAIAMDFYDLLADDVDIRGTDEVERVTVRRLDEGRVRVAITGIDTTAIERGDAFYDRTFLPSETDEVRIYLLGGDDRARVVGEPSARIGVRIIGGKGDDHLVDEAGGGATHLYDARGENRLEGRARTRTSTDPWDAPEPTEGLRAGNPWVPDWGGGMGWSPALGYGDFAGVVLGVGPSWTDYGFRRLPYKWQLDTRLLFATDVGSFGAAAALDYRLENSPLAFIIDARAVPFHSFRYYGLGNRQPDVGRRALVPEDRLALRSALRWHIGWRDREVGETLIRAEEDSGPAVLRPLVGRLDFGPVLLWSDPQPGPHSPFAEDVPAGERSLLRSGVGLGLRLDRTDRDAASRLGWQIEASATGFPGLGEVGRGWTEAQTTATAYLPLRQAGPHLAFRAGGSAVSPGAPPQHSAWVGGRTTLRGYRWQRYRGDAAAHGSAELRVPVTSLELFLRWNLGVFGLADAGRVWVDGDSPGGWHTGIGGGLWLMAVGKAVSAAYAHGEEGRFYLQVGLSY